MYIISEVEGRQLNLTPKGRAMRRVLMMKRVGMNLPQRIRNRKMIPKVKRRRNQLGTEEGAWQREAYHQGEGGGEVEVSCVIILYFLPNYIFIHNSARHRFGSDYDGNRIRI